MANRKKNIPDRGRAAGVSAKVVPKSAVAQATRRLVHDDSKMRVYWDHFDLDGPFCISVADGPTVRDLLRRINGIQKMTHHEAFGTGKGSPGTDYDVAKVPNSVATTRITELNLSDQTKISALRITGAERLWGFRVQDNLFYAVFWDPKHEIWPSPLKHT